MLHDIKRAYYYFFYKLYKFWESASDPKFWSDWKAGVSIITLELLIAISVGAYYAVGTKTILNLSVKTPVVFIILAIVIFLNYLAFIHTNKWKEYVKEFDQLPKRKNRIGSWVVLGIILLVLGNVFFSFYLMSRIDWTQYR